MENLSRDATAFRPGPPLSGFAVAGFDAAVAAPAEPRGDCKVTTTNTTIAVVGLGYVGLPLAVEFGKRFKTTGIDLSVAKVAAFARHVDPSGEVSTDDLRAAVHLTCSTNAKAIADADFVIIAVPTPVDEARKPDFTPLINCSEVVGRHLKRGATVVYESTVYPGATEEVCIPILEQQSGLRWKTDFFVGYSPERITPGDRERTVTRITKVVSGDTPQTLQRVADLYESIITAGVYPARSIKVAEAAKVIENTQRDLNVALMNELAVIFHRIGIDTLEVLEAAGTKWNFLPFRPGLVGGHCIGVDPYYLTHKAEMLGYNPQVILAGRRINDGMGKYIAEQTVKQMIACGSSIKGARVNVLGLTFKENCADLRNTKVLDIIAELKSYGVEVFVHDPEGDAGEAMHEYGVELTPWEDLPPSDAIVAAVAHKQYLALSAEQIAAKVARGGSVVDVKAIFDAAALRAVGLTVWRL